MKTIIITLLTVLGIPSGIRLISKNRLHVCSELMVLSFLKQNTNNYSGSN